MLLLLLNKQDMKDQMSNSSMQALAERKNRQVRTRKGQCLSATRYILSGVPSQASGGGRGLQAAAKLCLSRVHLAALGELVLTLLPASPKPLSEQ